MYDLLNETVKFYNFYSKTSGKLYAFTINKEYYQRFKEERNVDAFVIKKNTYDKLQSSCLMQKYSGNMMIEIVLNTALSSYTAVLGTIDENAILTAEIIKMEDAMNNLSKKYENSTIKDKYSNAVSFLTNITHTEYEDEKKTVYSNVNAFRLFVDLFGDTF